ncbi:MAG: PrsW family intramembrane metalloprotease [Ignavibacteriales bacterium]|nr:PrsW family intramembrane metalloprotease [Ignavibacteriales bacterium]
MNFIVALIPVFIFLLFLIYIDSFKLVKYFDLISCLIWGMISAGISYLINSFLLNELQISFITYSKYIAPLIEETLKASIIILLMYRGRIGFLIDGAVLGFAIGAGFSFVENIYYLNMIDSSNLTIWIVRGFGTALMHGSCTLIFSVIFMNMFSQKESFRFYLFFPGLIAAVVLHSIYNQFIVSPLISTLVICVSVPFIIILIFEQNEKSLRKWLEIEFDTELRLLNMAKSGQFSQTKSGRYIISIKDRFPGEIIIDMICYIRLYLELSLRAKSNLLLTESGFAVNKDEDVQQKLNELKYLKKNIGKTGILAISPVLRINQKDIWKLNQLGN